MKKKPANNNGRDRLEEALTHMLQTQAALSQNQAAFNQTQAAFNQNLAVLNTRLSETERENGQRFARIEADIGAILRVLAEHSRILQALPEAVRDKIGFKPQQ